MDARGMENNIVALTQDQIMATDVLLPNIMVHLALPLYLYC